MDSQSILLVRASIVVERPYGPGGVETRNGTAHFRPGAKVYVIDAHWGMCEAVTVIGHHRASGRYAKLDMSVRHLDGFRLDRSYSPKVILLVTQHFTKQGRQYSDDCAEELVKILPQWKEYA